MDIDSYRRFTDTLRDNLQADDRVVGLVSLGSMARQGLAPDAWSDHDFFVVVRAGTQESVKADLSWLPDHGEIVLSFRETEHGMKALYGSGHLVEFAVFDRDELNVARIDRANVEFGPPDLAEQLDWLRRSSREEAWRRRAQPRKSLAEFLCLLVVGAGRAARGEALSAHQFVKGWALGHLVTLLTSLDDDGADGLDPFRRFERAHPALGAELQAALLLPPADAARALLAIAERELGPRLPDVPAAAVAAVRRVL